MKKEKLLPVLHTIAQIKAIPENQRTDAQNRVLQNHRELVKTTRSRLIERDSLPQWWKTAEKVANFKQSIEYCLAG